MICSGRGKYRSVPLVDLGDRQSHRRGAELGKADADGMRQQMKVTTLLPLNDNNGRPFETEKIDGVLRSLAIQFNGCTTEGKVEGRSVHGGIEHRDESLRVTIVCESRRLVEIRQRIVEIGRELGQLSMYFEVRDDESVQFLPTQ